MQTGNEFLILPDPPDNSVAAWEGVCALNIREQFPELSCNVNYVFV